LKRAVFKTQDGRVGGHSRPASGRRPQRFAMRRLLVIAVVLVLVGGGVFLWYQRATARPDAAFRTAPVKRGDLAATISATGTIEPEEVVDVGAQVAGMIQNFGV